MSAQMEALGPSPTKLQQTDPSLTDRVRALYEDTATPVHEIARLAGVNQRTLYRYVAKGGWRRRYPWRGVEAAAANRGRAHTPRPGPPQPRGAGGRFVPQAEAGEPHPSGLKALDPQGAARAIAACDRASAPAIEAFARALALHDAERQARILALVVRAMRDLAAITDGEARRTRRRVPDGSAKPRKRRGYQWRPMGVPPAWAE